MGIIILIAVIFLLIGVCSAVNKGKQTFGAIYKELRPMLRYQEYRLNVWAQLHQELVKLGFFAHLRENRNRLFLSSSVSTLIGRAYRMHKRDFTSKLDYYCIEIWSRKTLLQYLEEAKAGDSVTAEVFSGRARLFSHFLIMSHMDENKNRINFIGYSQE